MLSIVSGYLWHFHSLLAREIVSILRFHKVSSYAYSFIPLSLNGTFTVARSDS